MRDCPDCGRLLGRGAGKHGLAVHACGALGLPRCTVCGRSWRAADRGGPDNDCADGAPSHAWEGRETKRKEDGRTVGTRLRRTVKIN